MLNWLIQIFNSIPSAFWGIVFGSGISLAGVVISNRASDIRQNRQNAHDRELKKRERELTLRKEIYLEAIEGVMTAFGALGDFCKLDVQSNELNIKYLEKIPVISKIHVIANESTIAAITKVTGALTAAYITMLAKRMPLVQKMQKIKILEEQIKSFESLRDSTLELMRQHNINLENNTDKFSVLESNFAFEQKRIESSFEELSKLYLDLLELQMQFVKESTNESKVISRLLVPAIVEIRKEIELPIDLSKYTDLIEESIKQNEEVFANTVQEFNILLKSK